jgi:hypothetical protein
MKEFRVVKTTDAFLNANPNWKREEVLECI